MASSTKARRPMGPESPVPGANSTSNPGRELIPLNGLTGHNDVCDTSQIW